MVAQTQDNAKPIGKAQSIFALLQPPKFVPVGWSEKHQQYRKCIGTRADPHGVVRPRIFWLGRDKAEAEFTASVLSWYYDLMVSGGQRHWSPNDEKAAMGCVEDRKEIAEMHVAEIQQQLNDLVQSRIPARLPTLPGTRSPAEESRVTFGEAARKHLVFLKTRQIGNKYAQRIETSLKQVHEVLPENLPLQEIGRAELAKVTGHFMSRPLRSHTKKPMAVDSVKTLFADLKRLLEALDGEEWQGPRGWQKLFRVRWAGLQTPQEQKKQAMGKQTFTLEELKDLHVLANDRTRLYMLLALNCGFAQKEIATLLLDDVDLDRGVIDRVRHKTRATAAVRGRWSLWPQTIKLLKKFVRETPSNVAGLALLTMDGQPLVHDESNTDSIGLRWRRLLKSAEEAGKKIRPLPYGALRKTSGTWVLKLSGNEMVQQMHLAHAPRSVAARHYTGERDFPRLADVLAQFQRVLEQASVLEPVAVRSELKPLADLADSVVAV